MEKQPNSRMCFVCGIDNPICLDGAPSASNSSSVRTTRGVASPPSIPSRSIRAITGTSLAFSPYDSVLPGRKEAGLTPKRLQTKT
jgi:hypothetical protein